MRLRILRVLETLGHSLEIAEQALVAGVRLGEHAQGLDKRPDVPANSATPNDWRDAGLGVGPDGGLAFVITVEDEVCLGVVGDGGDFVVLKNDVVCQSS